MPFLDNDVVELALREIPAQFKLPLVSLGRGRTRRSMRESWNELLLSNQSTNRCDRRCDAAATRQARLEAHREVPATPVCNHSNSSYVARIRLVDVRRRGCVRMTILTDPLRSAFRGYLPDEWLWRQKEQYDAKNSIEFLRSLGMLI